MIETVKLSKQFKTLVAVDSINLKIKSGDIFGFIGPNGAGKTTTIKMLATLLRPTDGDAMLNGYSIRRDPKKVRELIGYSLDFFGLYQEMKVEEYLQFFASEYSIPREKQALLIDNVLELTDLSIKKKTYLRGLSRGMQQRMNIARILLHDPKILLLDEPASGLDPRARIELRALLKQLKKMGKTIVISSHILTELTEVCNSIGIIEKGAILYQGPINDIIREIQRGIILNIKVKGDMSSAAMLLDKQQGVIEASIVKTEIETSENSDIHEGEMLEFIRLKLNEDEQEISKYAALLIKTGYELIQFKEEEINLEDVFLQVTKGTVS
ncbi:MAG: ABC transporter ATP-binding protein [Planctomycetes bacterium]|nr:ABC transporter ATP-binding protein [Planctomycetota bacterium]